MIEIFVVFSRPTNDNTVTKVLKQVSFRKEKSATPWQFSKDPIKKPLLRKTAFKEELRSTSCRCFLYILLFLHCIYYLRKPCDGK